MGDDKQSRRCVLYPRYGWISSVLYTHWYFPLIGVKLRWRPRELATARPHRRTGSEECVSIKWGWNHYSNNSCVVFIIFSLWCHPSLFSYIHTAIAVYPDEYNQITSVDHTNLLFLLNINRLLFTDSSYCKQYSTEKHVTNIFSEWRFGLHPVREFVSLTSIL